MRSITVRRSAAALATTLVAALAAAAPASAQLVADASGDFLSTYVGPRNGDVDVLGANVFYDGSTFRFVSRSNGAIGTTAGALFVWGIDRGQGIARFGPLAPGVTFDAVVVIDPLGSTTVRDLVSGVATTLPVGAVSFMGGDLTAVVSAGLLPSLGVFAPSRYTANLWPRVGNGNNNQISDFAPDNTNLAVLATPEPGTFLLALPALGALAVFRRRRTA